MNRTVSQTARVLGADVQQVKAWTWRFKEHLSSQANPPKGCPCTFTDSDVLALMHVVMHWEENPDFENIEAGLNSEDHYDNDQYRDMLRLRRSRSTIASITMASIMSKGVQRTAVAGDAGGLPHPWKPVDRNRLKPCREGSTARTFRVLGLAGVRNFSRGARRSPGSSGAAMSPSRRAGLGLACILTRSSSGRTANIASTTARSTFDAVADGHGSAPTPDTHASQTSPASGCKAPYDGNGFPVPPCWSRGFELPVLFVVSGA
jgi:hypothetical protein